MIYLALIIVTILILILNIQLGNLSVFLARKINLLDRIETAPERKFQIQPVPLSLAILPSIFTIIAGLTVWFLKELNIYNLSTYLSSGLYLDFNFVAILSCSLLLLFCGFIDDKYQINSKLYLLLIFAIIFCTVILGNLKIESLSYPLDKLNIKIGFLPQILAFCWILLCVAGTKFLDGTDGLVSSISSICFLTIASIANLSSVNQPFIVICSVLWAITSFSLLNRNFPEAKAYIGEGGSTILGFYIGTLSILSGAKIATASTIIGFFILDIILVMVTRIFLYKKISSALKGDALLHWHHRLKEIGLDKMKILVLTTIIILINSQIAINFLTQYKIYYLIVFFFLYLGFYVFTIPKKFYEQK